MSQVIFARPRHTYESYSDYFRLVELSGYDLIYMDEIDADSDNCYIFSTPATHWHDGIERRGWDNPRARIIYYNLEWYMDVDYKDIPGVEIWSADAYYAQLKGLKYVPLGSHPGLALEPLPPVRDYRYDVALLAYMPPRRQQMHYNLQQLGVSIAPNAWGKERHDILAQTKAMLHVHQNDGVNTVAPQRFALAAAYHMPIITEKLEDGGLFNDSCVLWSVFDHLARFTKDWTRNPQDIDNFGYALYHLLCEEHTFRKCIEAAL